MRTQSEIIRDYLVGLFSPTRGGLIGNALLGGDSLGMTQAEIDYYILGVDRGSEMPLRPGPSVLPPRGQMDISALLGAPQTPAKRRKVGKYQRRFGKHLKALKRKHPRTKIGTLMKRAHRMTRKDRREGKI